MSISTTHAWFPTNRHSVRRFKANPGLSKTHINRIYAELRAAGAVKLDFWLPESKALPSIIHQDEQIKGVVYGHCADGTAALVATDRRILFIDKKLFFLRFDEIAFSVVSAVTESFFVGYGTVTLHTRIGDYPLRTFNLRAARNFCEYIERQCLDQT